MSQIESHIGSTNADAVIHSVIQAVYKSLNIDEVFQEIVRALGIYLQADRCFIARFDEQTGVLSPPTKEYRSSDDIESMLDASPELWTILAELAKGICSCKYPVEFGEIPELSSEVQAQLGYIRVQAGLACIIRFHDDCQAVLFIHQVHQHRNWTDFEKEIVHLVSTQSAVAIHQAELYEQVQTQARRQMLLSQLYQQAVRGISLDALFEQALETMAQALDLHFGKIIEKTTDPEKPYLFRAVKGLDPDIVGQKFDAGGEPHANYTLESMEPIVVTDIYQETRFRPSPLHFEYGFTSGITAVIYGDQSPFGVLQADSREKRVFLNEDVYLMQTLANIIGLVAERKEVEKTLEAYQQKLEQSNQELEQFAMVASHDLKAPLRKIATFSSALQQVDGDKLSPEGWDYLKRINVSVDRMQAMVTGLLTLSSISRQGKPFRPVHLKDVVVEVLADLEPYRREVNGTVEVGELCVLDGDELQLNQMLQNLIGNALKFHRSGVSPVVKIDAKELLNGQCEITVEDNGIGFRREYTERIFEVFERLHGHQVYEGSGIGLALVKKIAERHGGMVKVDTTPGKGTTFTVVLPARQY